MKKTFGQILLASTILGVFISPVMAASGNTDLRMPVNTAIINVAAESSMTEGAKNFIASMGDRGINFLGNEKLSIEAKKAEFKSLLNQSFDMNTIGRFALGTYWKTATPAQQKEYQKLFNAMIVKVYSQRFSDYKGQTFDVSAARQESDKDSVVTSYIVPDSGPKVRVDWRVRSKNGSYMVVDIIVEGVSMSMTQRADFASVIQRGGGKVEALLSHLRE